MLVLFQYYSSTILVLLQYYYTAIIYINILQFQYYYSTIVVLLYYCSSAIIVLWQYSYSNIIIPLACFRLAQGLNQGLLVQGLYKACTRLVSGLYKACTRLVLDQACTRLVQGLYWACIRLVQDLYWRAVLGPKPSQIGSCSGQHVWATSIKICFSGLGGSCVLQYCRRAVLGPYIYIICYIIYYIILYYIISIYIYIYVLLQY